jgi:hypothetical protein
VLPAPVHEPEEDIEPGVGVVGSALVAGVYQELSFFEVDLHPAARGGLERGRDAAAHYGIGAQPRCFSFQGVGLDRDHLDVGP